MKDKYKTKGQLINELIEMRRQIAELEKALRKTEQEKAAVFDSMSEHVVFQDLEHRVTWANKAASKSVGLAPEKLAGRYCYKIWQKNNKPCIGCPVAKARETKQAQEAGMTTPEGRVWFIRGFPIKDANGTVAAMVEVTQEITECKRTEEALRESEERYRMLVQQSVEAIYMFDPQTKYLLEANPTFLNLLCYQAQEVHTLTIYDFIAHDRKSIDANIQHILRSGGTVVGKRVWQCKDGTLIVAQVTASKIHQGGRDIVFVVGRDITQQKRSEEALRESEEKYRSLINNVKLGIFRSTPGPTGRFLEVNPAMEEITGYSRKELLSMNVSDLYVHPEEREAVLEEMAAAAGKATKELNFKKKDGTQIVVSDTKVAIRDNTGKVLYFDGIIEDITQRKRAEERIRHLSLHDPLTGLYNRAYFEEEMKRLNTIRKYPVGIIMVDIDNLKFVNDAFGHHKGDELLKHLANILTSIFRKEDVVARIGGDEFATILPNVDEKITQSFCKRIINGCKDSNQKSLPELSVSLGYAIQYGQYEDMQKALKAADDHMYKEKLLNTKTVQRHLIDSLIIMWAERDPHTEIHSEKLRELAVSLGKDIGIPEHRLKDLRLLALLHNIGKVGIPDSILYKAGALSPEEWKIMKRHCEIGYRIAKNIPELAPIAEDILYHHEWWNGKGYPGRLKGEEIPILARIISIVDAYNTMLTDRPYKKALSREEATEELKRGAGTQFDPSLVERFLKIVENKLVLD